MLDEKIKVKYEIKLSDVVKVSCSSQGDTLLVIHVAMNELDKATSKGDHLFYCEPLVEFVTRLYLLFRKNNQERELPLAITDNFEVQIDRKGSVSVKIDKAEADETGIKKRGRVMRVTVSQSSFIDPADVKRRGGNAVKRPTSTLYSDLNLSTSRWVWGEENR